MFSLGPVSASAPAPRVLSPGHSPAPREPAGFPCHLLQPSFGGAGIMFFLSFPLPDTPSALSATRQCGQGQRLRMCYLPRELLSTRGAAGRGALGQHGSLKCCLSLRALCLSVGGAPARIKASLDGAGRSVDSQGLKMNRFGKVVHPPRCVTTFPLPVIWPRPVIMRVLSNRLGARHGRFLLVMPSDKTTQHVFPSINSSRTEGH